jgi:hypothetical protein
MHFTTFLATAAMLPVVLSTSQISYDPVYDTASESLSQVACSDGSHGLITRGYTTFGSLPHFPYIGGASAIPGWNSPQCGTCWSITYNGTTIHVLAIDHADSGFNIGENAMNFLTHGNAVEFGLVQATTAQVAASVCGLS